MTTVTHSSARYDAETPFQYAQDPPVPFAAGQPPNGWTPIPEQVPEFSLTFVIDRPNSKLLYGLKRRGMGNGLYNGFGGKPEIGESMLECAIRELDEESGLQARPEDMHSKGAFYICSGVHGRPRNVIKIVIFVCDRWTGELQETEEMIPKWFDVSSPLEQSNHVSETFNQLPYERMWPEASLFHPPLLRSFLDGRNDEYLIGQLEYEFVNPSSVPPWTVIRQGARPIPSKQEGWDEQTREALTGWWFAFASTPVPRE